mgnify:FL=1
MYYIVAAQIKGKEEDHVQNAIYNVVNKYVGDKLPPR